MAGQQTSSRRPLKTLSPGIKSKMQGRLTGYRRRYAALGKEILHRVSNPVAEAERDEKRKMIADRRKTNKPK